MAPLRVSYHFKPMVSVRFMIPLVCAALLRAVPVQAQPQAPVEPVLNQKGKDVQWVPSQAQLIEKMLDMAQVKQVPAKLETVA